MNKIYITMLIFWSFSAFSYDTQVKSYTRSNGIYVQSYRRTQPDNSQYNNYSAPKQNYNYDNYAPTKQNYSNTYMNNGYQPMKQQRFGK